MNVRRKSRTRLKTFLTSHHDSVTNSITRILREKPLKTPVASQSKRPEELSGLILSLESTCQDLFATGYFESDIGDDPP
ncbi:hypothetical protein F2P81_001603 [Scophthalmus maximus]|uniref:Uncharacterized protein n=1 Tax=Scophthalmus maximus TaxID=52904 RepID=A0A6A4TPC1_SCOMX|nr:hypothetical protein F2P81_001603 [Scophthalmus maximus]